MSSGRNNVEVLISGFLAKDPFGDDIIAPKDGIFVYTKKDQAKMKTKLAKVNKTYRRLDKYRFNTSINVPETFAPTVITNFTRGFVGLTLKKMLNKLGKSRSSSPDGR